MANPNPKAKRNDASSRSLVDMLIGEYNWLYNKNIDSEELTHKKLSGSYGIRGVLPESKTGEELLKATEEEETMPFKAFSRNKLRDWVESLPAGEKEIRGLVDPMISKSKELPESAGLYDGKERHALNEKIKDENFIYDEEWVVDAPLRPFTRGLLEQYKSEYSRRRNPVPDSVAEAEKGNITDENGNAKPNERQTKAMELNELIIEDVFPEYRPRKDDVMLKTLYKKMLDETPRALCLSGGGIRSATFALGIIQGLARLGIKPSDFTYLSTVSGGGYLGGWLSAWIRQDGRDKVAKELKPETSFPRESAPVRHLRTYSNYLSPKIGLFSADTWTLVATYLRNLFVNWLVIVPCLAAFTSLPWIVVTLLNVTPGFGQVIAWFVIGAVLLTLSDLFVKRNPPVNQERGTIAPAAADNRNPNEHSWDRRDQESFMVQCLLPGALAIFCWTLGVYWLIYAPFEVPNEWINDLYRQVFTEWGGKLSQKTYCIFIGISAGFVFIEWAIFYMLEELKYIPPRFTSGKSRGKRWLELLCLIIAGGFSGFLLITAANWMLPSPGEGEYSLLPILYACLAFPVFLLIILFNGFVYEGLKSKFVEDSEREWMARYSGWFLVVALGWVLVAGVILGGSHLVWESMQYVLPLGALTSYITAYLGQSAQSSGKPAETEEKKRSLISYISLPVLAFVALIILFIVLSFLIVFTMGWLSDAGKGFSPQKASLISPLYPVGALLIMLFICTIFQYAINMNMFSLHSLYRSRLIRAYLGASRPEGARRPDPFTGFDESDNLYMRDLAGKKQAATRPFHVVNMALNLVSGHNLAWQERKASSFTVSPLYAGSPLLGYRKTGQYGGPKGITLGTALAISGAAVSPNSGHNTSPLVAFFMTLFNLRLGWWLGNPGPVGDKTFRLSSPRWGLECVLNEMFGRTNGLNPYVFLSDGGHFENLGLYEMVLRRNRFILLSDASCDNTCELEDLGNAIRKIRIDLGVVIDFPLEFGIRSRNTPGKDENDKGKYWALGRIRYPEHSSSTGEGNKFGEKDGILLYIKPGIVGEEPKDIFNYASVSKDFPHESTADQFFSESQFESYRALGLFTIDEVDKQLKKQFNNRISIWELLNVSKKNWGTQITEEINDKIK